MVPITYTAKVTRTEHVPNERIVNRHHTATKDVDTITVAPSSTGTRLTWHAELTSPIPLLETVAIRMAAKGRSYGRQIEDTLAEVKRDVEAARAGHPAEPTP